MDLRRVLRWSDKSRVWTVPYSLSKRKEVAKAKINTKTRKLNVAEVFDVFIAANACLTSGQDGWTWERTFLT